MENRNKKLASELADPNKEESETTAIWMTLFSVLLTWSIDALNH